MDPNKPHHVTSCIYTYGFNHLYNSCNVHNLICVLIYSLALTEGVYMQTPSTRDIQE